MVVDNAPINVYNLSMENVESYIYMEQHVPGQINTTKNNGRGGGILLWQIPGSIQKATLPSARRDRFVIPLG